MLEWVLRRVEQAKSLDRVVVAVPHADLGAFSDFLTARKLGVFHDGGCVNHLYAGDEADVLGRYCAALRRLAPGASTVVRITADCPLVDPSVIDGAVALLASRRGSIDYVSTSHPVRMLPSGFDVEAMSASALLRAGKRAVLARHREHVTPYLYESSPVRCAAYSDGPAVTMPHLSVDTQDDFARVAHVLRRLGGRLDFTWREAVAAC